MFPSPSVTGKKARGRIYVIVGADERDRIIGTQGCLPVRHDDISASLDHQHNAWQYSEITCARIVLKGQDFSTENFQESPWQQSADILVYGERSGAVQVGYLKERPQSDEGPFLKEERSLLNAIAERLGEITELMRAEQQVREQRQFLQTVLDSLTHPFYVINAQDRTVEMANSAAHAGSLRAGITYYAFMHGYDQQCDTVEHSCPLQEVKRTKKPAVAEHVHVDQDGHRRDVEVHGFPILDREGNVVQMIKYALDITERKRTEERIRQNEMRLVTLEERERIGRELHDELGQVMGYVSMQAQVVQAMLEQGQPAQAQTTLAHLVEIAQDAHANVRQIHFGHPPTCCSAPNAERSAYAWAEPRATST